MSVLGKYPEIMGKLREICEKAPGKFRGFDFFIENESKPSRFE